jgi:hypothetical protein
LPILNGIGVIKKHQQWGEIPGWVTRSHCLS